MTIYGDVSESSVYIRYIKWNHRGFSKYDILSERYPGIPEENELRVLAIGVEPTAFWLVLRMFYQLVAG